MIRQHGLVCLAVVVAMSQGGRPTLSHADVIQVAAFDNATVQPAGPRTGTNGKRFFNVEGNDFGQFASFGVIDFQLPTPTVPYVSVSGLALRLEQSNASFTTDGALNLWVSEATTVGIQPGDPIAFDSTQLPDGLGNQLDPLFALGQVNFVQVANGHVDEYAFNLDGPIASYVLSQLNAGGVLRVVVSPGEGGVAATYAGFSNTTFSGPQLLIQAETIPEPSIGIACGLLAAATLLSRRRARTRLEERKGLVGR